MQAGCWSPQGRARGPPSHACMRSGSLARRPWPAVEGSMHCCSRLESRHLHASDTGGCQQPGRNSASRSQSMCVISPMRRPVMVCGTYRKRVEGSLMSSGGGCSSSILACLELTRLVLTSSVMLRLLLPAYQSCKLPSIIRRSCYSPDICSSRLTARKILLLAEHPPRPLSADMLRRFQKHCYLALSIAARAHFMQVADLLIIGWEAASC